VPASILQFERRLILLAAGTAARRLAMRKQGQRLIEQVEWARLAEALRGRRLLGILGPRIFELGEDDVDEQFATAVRRAIEAGRRPGAFLQLVALQMTTMLADAGIRSAALKGPLLGEAIYGDPGRRVSSDIDLLVSPDQLRAAVEVVRGLGYGAPTDHVYDSGLPLLHFALAHERGELPPVELHWRVHWYEQRFAQARLLPPSEASPIGWRPAPADELAALLLFYARDGFVDLRLATDLSAWWDVYGAELPSGALEEVVTAYHELARVIPAAARAAEEIVGLPANEILGRAGRLGARQRLAARLANPNPRGSAEQLYADMGLIDGLLAPPGELGAFVRRQLLPPREVLDQQAQHGASRRARSRMTRCVGVLARYGVTMIRLLGMPERFRADRA
jgi:Uncharacterised nucleotidyltransferase